MTLGSRALRGDAVESITRVRLSFVVVIRLLAQPARGTWWIDAVISLGSVGLLVKEDREVWDRESGDN